jgi:hypothetical protein
MRRKQAIEKLWPAAEKPKLEVFTPEEEKKQEASFTLDAKELAKALVPSLQRECPPCQQAKLSTHGYVSSKENILIILIGVLATTTLLCALMCIYLASASSRAIVKLESLLK